jgi:peptide/nickel transport system substrate-binding protein
MNEEAFMMGIARRRVFAMKRARVQCALAIVVLAISAVAVFAVVGSVVTVSAASAKPSKAAPFVVNWAFPPKSADPVEANNPDDYFIQNMYVTLTQYGLKKGSNGFPETNYNKVVPYLATKWRSLNGKRTWVFTLRRGAVFADGSPMDARAVKYSFNRAITRGGLPAIILNGNLGVGNLLASVEAPSATKVVIRLKKPYPRYYEVLTLAQCCAIVNPRIVQAHGGVDKASPNKYMATHAAGGGPYLLQSYDPGRRAVLLANPRFFGPKPFEKKVIVNFIPSDPTLLLQASKADVTLGLTTRSASSLRKKACCRVVANNYNVTSFIMLPNLQAPFNNRLFREGLSYAVPSAGIIKTVYYGYARKFFGPFPPANPAFNPGIEKARPLDLKKAQELIKQSGVTLPVDMDLLVQQGANDFAQIAAIIKDTWRQLRVNVNIKTVTSGPYNDALWGTPKKTTPIVGQIGGAYGFAYWIVNFDARCGNPQNTSNYCNPAASGLIDKAFYAPPAKQQSLWNQFATLWVRDVPRIPLPSYHYLVVLNKNVHRYVFTQTPLAIWMWGRK